jgi:hypothetical protein
MCDAGAKVTTSLPQVRVWPVDKDGQPGSEVILELPQSVYDQIVKLKGGDK